MPTEEIKMAKPVLIRNARTVYGPPSTKSIKIGGPADAGAYFSRLVGNDAREHFVSLWTNSRHMIVGHQIISIGTATMSLVHPREVFQTALREGACSLIIAHNHPSTDLRFSAEDRAVCRRLVEGGELLGVRILDFLAVSEGTYRSMSECEPENMKPTERYGDALGIPVAAIKGETDAD
jgi:DNA repair protein RadC